MRFDGEIIPPTTGRYTFSMDGSVGDKAALDLGKMQLSLNEMADAADPALTLSLQAGRPVTLHLEYQHRHEPGRVRLSWATPTQGKQVVPTSVFVDAWGRFLTNEGEPADHWLTLTGQWKQALTERLASPPGNGKIAPVH